MAEQNCRSLEKIGRRQMRGTGARLRAEDYIRGFGEQSARIFCRETPTAGEQRQASRRPIMATRADMTRHFAEISPVYRSVRTTDRDPVELIARELDGLVRPRGADIGCGAGRYVLLMFEMVQGLFVTCVDASPAMLEQIDGLLRANGIDEFETRQSTAECLDLEPGGYDFVSSFNAVHHFDFPDFLGRAREGLAEDGHLFVYTRLPEHNARSIWGRYFPGFVEKETRLLTLGDLHGAIEDAPGLRFAGATCLRYRRQAPLERLLEQARNRHYSTFSLYEPDEFEDALVAFRAVVERRFGGPVEWYDENVLIHAVRADG